MKILVIGGGGREHALVWKFKQSDKVATVFCAPGNAGIRGIATCVDITTGDIPALLNFALKEHIDLTEDGP
jgi:phosphoribosylamine--glycine ligase